MSDPRPSAPEDRTPRQRVREMDSDGFAHEAVDLSPPPPLVPGAAAAALPPRAPLETPRSISGGSPPVFVRRRHSGGINTDGGRPISDGFGNETTNQGPRTGLPSASAAGRSKNSNISGGFGVDVAREESYAFDGRSSAGQAGVISSSGVIGPGRSGNAPTAEIEAAQEILLLNLRHEFVTREPLAAALTHPSLRNEKPHVTVDNQRLELLGDLVLGLAVGELLLMKLPNSQEGEISVMKSHLVRERTLAELAVQIGVGPALRLGRGEDLNGGRQRPAILADALEAIIAAVFVDSGYESARALVERLMTKPIADLLAATQTPMVRTGRPVRGQTRPTSSTTALHASTKNYKTALQEWLAHAGGDPPEYKMICEFGALDARRFRVRVATRLLGALREGLGEATTIKAAENAAAEQLFMALTA